MKLHYSWRVSAVTIGRLAVSLCALTHIELLVNLKLAYHCCHSKLAVKSQLQSVDYCRTIIVICGQGKQPELFKLKWLGKLCTLHYY